ncbi:hypothetical protein MCOR04_009787 [Pyricularia oryzae]|nr:hypothetical protein MCOR17_001025 [Pyricularia oryzae]KAI6559782.1 hypothetical protein MCOR04_009787 [Pyricularia oryzae]
MWGPRPSSQGYFGTEQTKADAQSTKQAYSCVLSVEPDSGISSTVCLAPRVGPTRKAPPRAMICQLSPGTPKVSHVKQFAPNTLSKPFRHGASERKLVDSSLIPLAAFLPSHKGGRQRGRVWILSLNESPYPDVSSSQAEVLSSDQPGTQGRSTFDRADVMQGISSLTATLRGGMPYHPNDPEDRTIQYRNFDKTQMERNGSFLQHE